MNLKEQIQSYIRLKESELQRISDNEFDHAEKELPNKDGYTKSFTEFLADVKDDKFDHLPSELPNIDAFKKQFSEFITNVQSGEFQHNPKELPLIESFTFLYSEYLKLINDNVFDHAEKELPNIDVFSKLYTQFIETTTDGQFSHDPKELPNITQFSTSYSLFVQKITDGEADYNSKEQIKVDDYQSFELPTPDSKEYPVIDSYQQNSDAFRRSREDDIFDHDEKEKPSIASYSDRAASFLARRRDQNFDHDSDELPNTDFNPLRIEDTIRREPDIDGYRQRAERFLASREDDVFDHDEKELPNKEGFQRSFIEQAGGYLRSLAISSIRSAVNALIGEFGIGYDSIATPEGRRQFLNNQVKGAKQYVVRQVTSNIGKSIADAKRKRIELGRKQRNSEDRGGSSETEKDLIWVEKNADDGSVYTKYQLSDLINVTQRELESNSISKKFQEQSLHTQGGSEEFYRNRKLFHAKDEESELDYENEDIRPLSNYLIKFNITNLKKSLIFRMANFIALSDSLTPEYTDIKYIGRPEAFPMYTGVSRRISFTFSVYVLDPSDINPIYNKLNKLIGLTYPYQYTNTNIIQPNIIKLSIGKYVQDVPFFIRNLTYTSDDDLIHQAGKPIGINITVEGTVLSGDSSPVGIFQVDVGNGESVDYATDFFTYDAIYDESLRNARRQL